jgi:hypothetical protein
MLEPQSSAVKAMISDDVGAAIGRLVDVARSDTDNPGAANFLLAWWNGDDWGYFPIADLFGVYRCWHGLTWLSASAFFWRAIGGGVAEGTPC